MDLSKHFVLLNGEPKTLQIDTIQKVSSKQNDEHPRRSIRTSASVDAYHDSDTKIPQQGTFTT